MTVEIVPCDTAHLAAAIEDVSALAALVGGEVAPGLIEDEFRGDFRFALAELQRRPELSGWWTALFVQPSPRTVCGMGGFRGPPDASGMVEIGYSIAPGLRGRGLATEAARELVRIALADARVRWIQAHTLAQANASTRVLEKLGFRKVAELLDPKEHPDPIWRWRLDR